MLALIAVGVLAGVITSISLCVLPVLPVVLAAGDGRGPAHAKWVRSWRPYWVVFGLVLSFCTSTLAGSLLLGAVGLPQDLLRDIGIGVLVLVGLGMICGRSANWSSARSPACGDAGSTPTATVWSWGSVSACS